MKEIIKYYKLDGRLYSIRLLLVQRHRGYEGNPLHRLRIFLTVKPF